MPMNIGALRKGRQEFDMDLGGETLHVVFSLDEYTAELEDELLSESQKSIEGSPLYAGLLIPVLSRLVLEWDLVDDEQGSFTGTPGAPIPPTEANLRKIPSMFLIEVLQAIRTNAKPSSEEGKTSPGGSFSAT